MLTDLQIRSLTYDGKQRDYADRDGLFLRRSLKAKTWVLTVRQNGERRYERLGTYPTIGLSKARSMAKDRLAALRLNPQPHTLTFKEALDLYLETRVPGMRAATQYQVRYLFRVRFLAFHDIPLSALSTAEIAAEIDSITSAGQRMNAAIYLRALLNWCFQRGHLDRNPMDRLRGSIKSSVARDYVIPDRDIISIWNSSLEGNFGAFIRILILTAQRKGQFLQFDPSMLDRENKLLIFPASVMKSGRLHVIPATDTMISLIANHQFGHWNETTQKRALLKASGTTGWRLHDLRRTAVTRMADLGVQPHILQRLLSHSMPGVTSRYVRASYLPELAAALNLWEQHLVSLQS